MMSCCGLNNLVSFRYVGTSTSTSMKLSCTPHYMFYTLTSYLYSMSLYYKFFPNVQLIVYCHICNSLPYPSLTVCCKYCSYKMNLEGNIVSRARLFVGAAKKSFFKIFLPPPHKQSGTRDYHHYTHNRFC